MPLVVACPQCNAKFKLPDELVGKPVQCKACQARFQVGKPRKALPDKSAGKAGTVVATSTVSPEQQAEMAKLGIDGPLQSRPDLFRSGPISPADPLANHVVEDPGFAGSGNASSAEQDAPGEEEQDEYAAVFVNPAIVAPKDTKSKVDPLAKYLAKEGEFGESVQVAGRRISQQAGWLKVGFLLLFFLLAFVLSFSMDTMYVPFLFFLFSFFLTGMVGLALLVKGAICVAKNTNSVLLGIVSFVFIPLMIYFLFAHWSKPYPTKDLLFSFAALMVVQGGGFLLMVIALLITGISDPSVLFNQ
ncbi:MAG: zinc-ribbon domain-containing protein [Mariniblastus sp.]|nr:zinc-ribbon domain-containing protein [Mariniblastus sp.]